MLEFENRPDPIQRTTFIETLPAWHADLALLQQQMAETEQSGLRSGICLAFGSIADVDHAVRSQWEPLLKDWYTRQPDTGSVASPTPDHPVQQVSWYDAVKFCNWLSRREGRMPCYELKGKATQETGRTSDENWELISAANGYRLPTEGEWEHACRAESQREYTFGDDVSLLGKYGVFLSNSTEKTGSRLPNAWGLFDMHGNVFEWCHDWYKDYGTSRVNYPLGPAEGPYRVIRGGSWAFTAEGCRSALRLRLTPGIRGGDLGFRLARSSVE